MLLVSFLTAWLKFEKPSCWIPWDISYRQGCTSCAILPAWLWERGERMKKWRGNGEKMRKWWERVRKCGDIHSLHFLIFSLFPPSLSISYIENCLILSQNVKLGIFVTKNLTYALWENNSGSNSLWESSLSCDGLPSHSKELSYAHICTPTHSSAKAINHPSPNKIPTLEFGWDVMLDEQSVYI